MFGMNGAFYHSEYSILKKQQTRKTLPRDPSRFLFNTQFAKKQKRVTNNVRGTMLSAFCLSKRALLGATRVCARWPESGSRVAAEVVLLQYILGKSATVDSIAHARRAPRSSVQWPLRAAHGSVHQIYFKY